MPRMAAWEARARATQQAHLRVGEKRRRRRRRLEMDERVPLQCVWLSGNSQAHLQLGSSLLAACRSHCTVQSSRANSANSAHCLHCSLAGPKTAYVSAKLLSSIAQPHSQAYRPTTTPKLRRTRKAQARTRRLATRRCQVEYLA